jgi:hypothetical protein
MREIVTLNGHKHAVTHILVDAAGRYIFSGSVSDNTILIWDGLSFTCEKQIENVNVSSMVLSHNALVVGSFKAPFLRVWKVKYAVPQSKQVNKSSSVSTNFTSKNIKHALMFSIASSDALLLPDNDTANEFVAKISPDFMISPEEQIVAVRSSRWAFSVLKGGAYVALKAVIEPKYVEEEEARAIVSRWFVQYDRPDAQYISNLTNICPLLEKRNSQVIFGSALNTTLRTGSSTGSLKSGGGGGSFTAGAQSFKQVMAAKRLNRANSNASNSSASRTSSTVSPDKTNPRNKALHTAYSSSAATVNMHTNAYRGVVYRIESEGEETDESVLQVTCDEDVMNAIQGLEKFSPQNKQQQQFRANSKSPSKEFKRTDKHTITTTSEEESDALEEDAVSEDSSVVRLRAYRADRHKKTKSRGHFSSSDDDESDGERVKYFGAGVVKTRPLGIEEMQQRGGEVVQHNVDAVVATRQRKLRPRLVHHLNDTSSSSGGE